MKSGLISAFLAFSLVPLSLLGQEEERAGIDLADAVKRLRGIGWESVAGASWGRFESQSYPNDGGLNPYSNPYGSSIRLQGNAWLQPGEEAQKVVYGGGFRAYYPKQKAEGKKGGFLKKLLRGGGGEEEGFKWSEKSLEDDLETLHDWILSGKATDEFNWQYQRKGTESMALILALQLYESGRQEEGQKLANALMGVTLNGEDLVDGLVSGLAERQLKDLTAEFCESKESRESYLRDLKELQVNFARGWDGVAGVQRLVALLEKSDPNGIGLTPPEGITLKAEQVTLLEEMAGAGSGLGRAQGADWIWGGQVSKQMSAPFREICLGKMDGFLALAIAAGDETLTRRRLQGGGSDEDEMYRRMNRSFNNQGLDLEEVWQNMDRPATRAEFAKRMLVPVLPGKASDYQDLDALGIQQEALAFWKKHRESTPAQLAASYLEGGSTQQVVAAVSYLMENGESEALALFEQQVLAQPDFSRWSEAVKAYLKKGRGDTREFWEKLRPEWERQLEGLDQSEYYEMGMHSGSPKTVLKIYDRYAGGKSMADLLRTLAQEEDFEKVGMEFRTLAEGLEEMAEEKRTATVLAAMESSDSDAYLLMGFYYLSYFGPESDELMGKGKEFWTVMLAKTEELPTEMTRGNFSNLAEFSAYVLELAAEENPQALQEKSQVMGDQFYPFCLERSSARIAEEEIPGWPDADNVDKARWAKMLAQIEAAPPSEKGALIKSWSLDEKMVWSRQSLEWEEEGEFPAWFRELKVVVTESQLSADQQAQLKGLALGAEVSDEWLKELIANWPKDKPELDGLALSLLPAESGMGFKAGSAAADAEESAWLVNYLEMFEEELEGKKFFHFLYYAGSSQHQIYLYEGLIPEDNEEWDEVMAELKSYHAAAQGEPEEGETAPPRVFLYLTRITADSLKKIREKMESEEE